MAALRHFRSKREEGLPGFLTSYAMPTVFNNIYRSERVLGAGGFGTVFLARENVSNRLVAIKQLNNQDAARQQDIVHEVQMVSQFNHPNIATYHHNFSENGRLYLVMEYCSGGSVCDVRRLRPIPPTEVLSWIQILAGALAFVHSKKIIHHDIKPANLLLTEQGTIKISDFGVANRFAGTRAYMSPEALEWDAATVADPRVDIYALGVTLMELLTGQNPFGNKSPAEIQILHLAGDFPIKSLPDWQQEIILKAIHRVPELRFQSMSDFAAAIEARNVPLLLDKNAILAGRAAERAEKWLSSPRWHRAESQLDFIAKNYPTNVNALRALGRFYLKKQMFAQAKSTFEQAIKLNPRMDVQKDLGCINLALKDYPSAISLLGDHLHRNPSDLEAQNLLIQCFYETGRYEIAMSLARTILEIDPHNPCFASNYYLASLLLEKGRVSDSRMLLGDYTNPFITYNRNVVSESKTHRSWQDASGPKSKLLFMDYRFLKLHQQKLFISTGEGSTMKTRHFTKFLVTFGREGYQINDEQIGGGVSVSRRHCVVVNSRDNVWLYDLASVGTRVNGEKVEGRVQLLGKSVVQIDEKEFVITAEKDSLL